ncbi:MAG: hypothetical protein GX126_02565, partial [Bacteroidales bacterium]|nr:hypothetical protein [Bacteroidales bacterium]
VMVPLTDTFRVITIRLLNKKSPFYPDNNHIHHRLLALIPDHFTVTIILTSVSIILILLSVLFDFLFVNVTMQFIVMFFIRLSISFIPSYLVEKKQEKHKSEKYHHIYY